MSLPGMVEGVRGSPTIKRPVAFDNMTSPFDVDVSVRNMHHSGMICEAQLTLMLQSKQSSSTRKQDDIKGMLRSKGYSADEAIGELLS